MPYPRKLLRPGETVAVDVRPHWWYLAKPVVAVTAAIVAGVASLAATDGGSVTRDVAGWLAVAALVASSCWLVARYVRWGSSSLVVTTDRIVYRTGVLAKSSVELPLDRVSAVRYRQCAPERLIGAGDVIVSVGGEHGGHRFPDLRNPARLQRAIHVQLDAQMRRPSMSERRPGPADQLERLDGMFERGTLTRDQYESQKSRVLQR